MHIGASAQAQLRERLAMLNFERAFGAKDMQAERVGVTSHEAAGMDDAQRAVAEFDRHHGAVVHIERVVADLVSGGLVEGLQPRLQRHRFEPGGISRKVENVDADIAEHAA